MFKHCRFVTVQSIFHTSVVAQKFAAINQLIIIFYIEITIFA